MKTFYGDDTYAKSNADDDNNRLHIFGGIYISKSAEKELIEIIRDVKSKYAHPNLPIKWNFKDNIIKEKFETFGWNEQYKSMLIASNDWRKEIFQRSLKLDYKIICGVIESYSKDKDIIKDSKEDLLKFTFENVLIQLGFESKSNTNEIFVVLDWPPDGNSKPFLSAYYKLYNNGKTSAGRDAYCGKLTDCNFNHTLLFAKCSHSPMLQFCDLIVGSLKDFLESNLKGKKNNFAEEIFTLYRPKFRTYDSEILKHGLVLSSGNASLSQRIAEILKKNSS